MKSEEGELKNADFSDGIQLVLKNGNRYEELKGPNELIVLKNAILTLVCHLGPTR